MKKSIIGLALILSACNKYETKNYLPALQSPVTNDPVAEELILVNATRTVQGLDPLTPGLDCNVYSVPSNVTGIAGASLTGLGSFLYLGEFNQPNAASTIGINVLPVALQNSVTSLYVLKCTGELIVGIPRWSQFVLGSDDGAILSVDGQLINNDGTHALQTKTAAKFLSIGAHSFELDYLDIGGSHALILSQDGAIMSSNGLVH